MPMSRWLCWVGRVEDFIESVEGCWGFVNFQVGISTFHLFNSDTFNFGNYKFGNSQLGFFQFWTSSISKVQFGKI